MINGGKIKGQNFDQRLSPKRQVVENYSSGKFGPNICKSWFLNIFLIPCWNKTMVVLNSPGLHGLKVKMFRTFTLIKYYVLRIKKEQNSTDS